jgi:hypothetical protein
MPDPANYESEDTWMAACVPTMLDEGAEQEQAVAALSCSPFGRGLSSYEAVGGQEVCSGG